MNRYAKYGIACVLGHGLVGTVHGLAHKHMGIDLTFLQRLFIIFVITLAPLLAALLLWTRLRKVGAVLLLFSMLGSLIFGVVNHFLIPSPDHVLHLPVSDWRLTFQATAVLLVITESLGCWIAALALRAEETF
jgi:hypothetical protein